MDVFDRLTGVLSKENFYEAVRELLQAYPERHFELLRTDVERFKIINELFGEDAGDRLLCLISQSLQDLVLRPAVIGRLHSDHFVVFYEAKKECRQRVLDALQAAAREFSSNYHVVIDSGVYCVREQHVPVSVMCDHANLALQKTKGNYFLSCSEYDEQMGAAIRKEQLILNAMEDGLKEGQFKVWLQPKYELLKGRIVGAEALVRWEHPVQGMISPAEFIPIFERNGFIFQLDSYIWEETCRLLAHWRAAGLRVLPVSVNISRMDVYHVGLCELFERLVKTYHLEPSLLELEITESASTDNAQQIIELTEKLREKGFTILMDDFGSGYSSLNMLKEVSVDVLKLDLRFLSSDDESGRGGNILNSVVRMAKWLNLKVIAEGVETKEQAEFLRNIGCEMVQGYYFSKPMSVEQYEQLIKEKGCCRQRKRSRLNAEDMADIWNPHTQYSLIFNNDSCGIAMVELSRDGLELLRGNEGYFQLASGQKEKHAPRLRTVLPYLSDADRKELICLLETYENQAETELLVHWCRADQLVWLNVHVMQIMRDKERALFYLFLHDVTNLQQQADMLHDLLDNFPGGIGVYELLDDAVYVRYMSPDVMRFNGIAPENFSAACGARIEEYTGTKQAEYFCEQVRKAYENQQEICLQCALTQADGEMAWIEIRGRVRENGNHRIMCYAAFRRIACKEHNLRTAHEVLGATALK